MSSGSGTFRTNEAFFDALIGKTVKRVGLLRKGSSTEWVVTFLDGTELRVFSREALTVRASDGSELARSST